MVYVKLKVWTKEEILAMLERSPAAVIRGVLAIYREQTPDEQYLEVAKHLNARGFNKVDAQFGTEIAQKILQGDSLTQKQVNACRKMLRKYSGQLVRIANGQA